ncbi:hypothetical protein HD554DRAFT_1142752 [Boletus coccyginus]|nr:hypothetical protein HD554DRAFT_1142752 [Boletus coccyginus]
MIRIHATCVSWNVLVSTLAVCYPCGSADASEGPRRVAALQFMTQRLGPHPNYFGGRVIIIPEFSAGEHAIPLNDWIRTAFESAVTMNPTIIPVKTFTASVTPPLGAFRLF